MKTLYKRLRYIVLDCIRIKRDAVKLGMYNLTVLSIIWWVLSDIYDAKCPLILFFLVFPTIWCSLMVAATDNNGTLPDEAVCPTCGVGVFDGCYCTLSMDERFHYTCGTTGVIRGTTGMINRHGSQCLRNQTMQQGAKDDVI